MLYRAKVVTLLTCLGLTVTKTFAFHVPFAPFAKYYGEPMSVLECSGRLVPLSLGLRQTTFVGMSYVADSSDYSGEGSEFEDSEEDGGGGDAGIKPGMNEMADVPTVEEQPVPMSKNSGSRFVSIIWDHDLDKEGRDREELHEHRSDLIEEHILWARRANLYNETFNWNSMADVVWSYPLLSSDKRHMVGQAICIDSNAVAHAKELLSREPTIQSLTEGDISKVQMYRWRHLKDYSLRQDDGRFGTPTMIINMDRTDEAVAGLREATNVSHIEYLIDSERVVMAGPLHLLTEEKDDPASVAVGSIVIMNAEDRAHAIKFAENDPCALAGLYATIRVQLFNHLDVSGKFVQQNYFDPDEVDHIREAMENWGYPVDDRQTKWING